MIKKILQNVLKPSAIKYDSAKLSRNVYQPERPLNFVSRADQRFSLLKRS